MTTRSQSWNDQEAWLLSDAHLEATVLPAYGGKIAGLVDRLTGRDWLWRNPFLPISKPRPGASYVLEHDCGGYDECFPAVSAGPYPVEPWRDREIPDHGELWAVPWEVEPVEDGIRMRARTRRFPPRFERMIRLQDGCLRLDYRVENPTPHAFPFIWSAHPLFALEAGMRIELPEGHPLEVYGSDRLGDRHAPVTWPFSGGIDLSRPARVGFCAKLAGPAPERGWIGLTHEARRLKLSYDPALVPDLGLWLNDGGWTPLEGKPPYFNLGLEPCIGWGDDLAYAVREGLPHGVLPPHGERTWWLEIRFEGLSAPGEGRKMVESLASGHSVDKG